jgi:N-acetylglutamate synthase-like GNAT family acetyltransferase
MAVDVAPSHFKNGAGSQGTFKFHLLLCFPKLKIHQILCVQVVFFIFDINVLLFKKGRSRPKRQQSSNSNASGSRSAPGVKKTTDKTHGHRVSNSQAKVFKIDPKSVPKNGNRSKTQMVLQKALAVEQTHKLTLLKKKEMPEQHKQCQELLRERLPNLLEKERKILDSLETYVLTPSRSPQKVCAFMSLNLQPNGGFTEIVFLCCKEKSRGWGSRMVHHARQLACDQGLDYILLHASLDAIGFFDKVGFTKDIDLHEALWFTRVNHFHNSTLMGLRMYPPDSTKKEFEDEIKRTVSKFPTNRVVVDFQGVERLAKILGVDQGIATIQWPHSSATQPAQEFIRNIFLHFKICSHRFQ